MGAATAVSLPRRASRYARLVLKPRNRELLGLIPAALLVTAGFTAIFIQQENSSLEASTNVTLNHASSLSLTYGLLFLGLCLAAHLVIRFALPYADPYLFPLGGGARERGDRDGLPHQPIAGAPAGAVDGAGLDPLRRHDPVAAAHGYRCARALPLHDRGGRDRDGGPAALPGDRRAGQRRLSGHPLRLGLLPAGRAREGRDRDLPGQLPARQPPDPGDGGAACAWPDPPADEAVRADARRVGGGDGHAAVDGRAWHLADVLWRVPGAAVRRDRPLLVPADRARAVRLGCLVRDRPRRARPRSRARLGTSVGTEAVPQRRAATSLASRCSLRPTAVCSARASTSRCW